MTKIPTNLINDFATLTNRIEQAVRDDERATVLRELNQRQQEAAQQADPGLACRPRYVAFPTSCSRKCRHPSPTKTGSLPAPPKYPTTPPMEKTDPPVIPDADRSLTSPSGHVARRPTLLKRVQHLLRQMMGRPKPHLLHLFRLVRRQTPTAHPFPTVGTHRQHLRTHRAPTWPAGQHSLNRLIPTLPPTIRP